MAAMAAACGAAQLVPKKGAKPGGVVVTPSAAVKSGFSSTLPPVELKLPGVMGVPSGLKNIRRGPSELNFSTTLPELKADGYGPVGSPAPKAVAAGVAATVKEFAASHALFPRMHPAVSQSNMPRPKSRWMNRFVPLYNVTTK